MGNIYSYKDDNDDIEDLIENPLSNLIVKDLYRKIIIDISCADFHSVALEDTGVVYTWGGGGSSYNKGQCGHGNLEDSSNPRQVE